MNPQLKNPNMQIGIILVIVSIALMASKKGRKDSKSKAILTGVGMKMLKNAFDTVHRIEERQQAYLENKMIEDLEQYSARDLDEDEE
jgi:hypothetical protein